MKKILCCTQGIFKLFFCILFSVNYSLYSQSSNEIDYKKEFGNRYTEAAAFLSQDWINDTLVSQNVNPCFAKSIVFPELIRYSSLKDHLEVHGLVTLYIQFGKTYANFSIGHFQMKPGFAELIEKDAYVLFSQNKELLNIDTADNSNARLARIRRLDNPLWQLRYLIWFIRIAEKKFASNEWKAPADKLKFFATAYNCGYNRSQPYILKMTQAHCYYTSLFKSDTCFNYADISLSYFHVCK